MPTTFISNNRTGGGYTVPINMTILWKNGVSLPSGFDSYTEASFGDYYPAAGSVAQRDANNTGGSANHTHTISLNAIGEGGAHTHIPTGTSTAADGQPITTYGTPAVYSVNGHTHTFSGVTTTSTSGAHTHTLSTGAASGANLPEYNGVMWLKSTSDNTALPVGAILMWWGSAYTLPDKFKICDGTNGTTIDMRSKFMRLKTLNGGISPSHTHSLGALSSVSDTHAHTYNFNSTAANIYQDYSWQNTRVNGAGSHSHGISFTTGNATGATHSHPAYDANSSDSLPSYLEVYFIQYLGN